MRKRLLELGLYLLAPIAIFVTSPFLAQGLGPAERGVLGVVQSVASFAAAAGALGQAEVLIDDLRRGDASLRRRGAVSFTGALVACALGCIVATSLGVPLHVAVIALLFVPVINQSQMWRSFAISRGRLALPGAANAAAAVIRTVSIYLLFCAGLLTAASAIASIQGALALGAVLFLGVYFYRARAVDKATSDSDQSVFDLIRRGSPILAFTVLTTITLRADVIVLSVLSTPEQLGVYAATSALSMAVLSVSGAFKTRAQAAAFSADPRRAVFVEVAVVAGVGFVGALLAVWLAPLLVSVLLGEGYESAIPLLRVLGFASALLMILDVVHGLLAVLGARVWMIAVSCVGAASALGLLFALVGPFGAMGAAWASLLSYGLASVFGLVVIQLILRPRIIGTARS